VTKIWTGAKPTPAYARSEAETLCQTTPTPTAAKKVAELAQHNPQAAYIVTKYSLTSRGTNLGRNHINDITKAMDTQLTLTVGKIASTSQACTTDITTVPHCTALISMPTKQGGLGIHLPSKVANSAYIAAAAATINYCTEAPHTDKLAKDHLSILKTNSTYGAYLSDTLNTLRNESNHNQNVPASVAALIANAKEVKPAVPHQEPRRRPPRIHPQHYEPDRQGNRPPQHRQICPRAVEQIHRSTPSESPSRLRHRPPHPPAGPRHPVAHPLLLRLPHH
jgi:hypothetical protein